MATKKLSNEEVAEAYSSLTEQYNTLLEKNQNDLVKIRQKEKALNDTISSLKSQMEEDQKKYKMHIDQLVLEMEKMKNGVNAGSREASSKELAQQAEADLALSRKQVGELKRLVDLKAERIEHLEENVRKMMDENIDLTEKGEKLKEKNDSLESTVKRLEKELADAKNSIKIQQKEEKQAKTMKQTGILTEGDYTISEKEHKELVEKFNHQIQILNQGLEESEKKNEGLKNRLRETNEELKRYMERDKKNTHLLKKKNEEIQSMQKESEATAKKTKVDKKRLQTDESCGKCKEWEQECKLLKEMVRSLQTMVRVREMEAERYKNRQALNNSKVQEPETKRSRTELPPLKKSH